MLLLIRKQSALTDFPPFHPMCVRRSSKQHRVFVWEEPLHVCGQRVWRVYLHPRSVAVWRGQRLWGPQRRGWMQWVHHSQLLSFQSLENATIPGFLRTEMCTSLHPVSHIVLIFRHHVKSPHTVIHALSVVVMLAALLSWCHGTKLLFTWGCLLIKSRNKMTTYHHHSSTIRQLGQLLSKTPLKYL